MTDDERREVARKIRGFVTDDSVYADVDACRVLHSIGLYYKDIDRIYFSGFDVARLADLIEPCCDRDVERTCRVESSHEEEGDGCYSYFKYELTCGHEMAWGDQLPPSYCPECGRRVLYDSDDYI